MCQETESAGHVHGTDCYGAEGTLICGLEEGQGAHTHDESCYETQKVLVCGLTEGEAEPSAEPHVHTDDCYELKLICTKTEHTHSLACFSNPEADVEMAVDWEKTMKDVELTGNYSADLLQIARTQLGYAESDENYAVDTDPDTGAEMVKGYTRYGAWYGDAYGDWCAMYISFCLNYADIPAEDLPREASCPNWVELLQSEDWKLYHSGEEDYTPNPGDLVFFDWDGDGEADHVGIAAALSAEETDKLSASDREKALDKTIQALTATDSLSEGSEVLAANGTEPMVIEETGNLIAGDAAESISDGAESLTEVGSGESTPENTEAAAEEPIITLITIEGNSGNKVQTQAYRLDDDTILGYGQLPLSDYQSVYDAMAEILEEIKTMNPENDEEAQALCLDACMRLGDLLDMAYDACDEGRMTEEQLGSLETLYEEALAYMLDTYGFDPYGISLAAYSEVTDVTLRAYVSRYEPKSGAAKINGYTRTLISDTASLSEGETAPVVLANGTNRKNCLIPVSWLLEQYGAYGYTFDETNPGTSPFVSFAGIIEGQSLFLWDVGRGIEQMN